VAVNVNTGKVAWRSTLGVSDNLPPGKQDTGRPGFGGPTLTASGLAFIGATDDARFRAFDTKTGKEIWTYRLPASAESIPITYADSHGEQYVAVVATGGSLLRAPLLSDEVIAFSLDGGPDGAPNVVQASPNPRRVQTGSASTQATHGADAALLPQGPGRDLTANVCSACHSLEIVRQQRLTADDWHNVVQTMSAKGAKANDDELRTIEKYLVRAFPRTGKAPASQER
jgi:quinoprotein glucose dehydrogenase